MKQFSLETLQHDFLEAWLNQDIANDFTGHIKQRGDLSQQARLEIYQGSILAGLAKALSEIYPVCERLVGTPFFTKMAYYYVKQTPSDSPGLVDYGVTFPTYVASFKPAQSLVYLADVCRLELAWHRAYHSASSPGIDIKALSQLNEAEMQVVVLRLADHSTLIQSEYPIDKIWSNNQENIQQVETIHLGEGGVKLFVFRRDAEIKIDVVPPDEWHLLQLIDAKIPFAKLCTQSSDNNSETDIIHLLTSFLGKGWLGGCYQSSS